MNPTIKRFKIIARSASILMLLGTLSPAFAESATEVVKDSIVRLDRPVTTNMKAVISKAMANPGVKMRYELRGEIANSILTQTKGKAPVNVEVYTVQRLTENGCYRLTVAYTLPNTLFVRKDTNVKEPFAFWQQMNLCENGMAPSTKEGANPLAESSTERNTP
jgi:hypothetical protein